MTVIPFEKPVLVFVQVAPSGAWVIRDAAERRGGRFVSGDAAMAFIKREFGIHTVLVFRPWPMRERAA